MNNRYFKVCISCFINFNIVFLMVHQRLLLYTLDFIPDYKYLACFNLCNWGDEDHLFFGLHLQVQNMKIKERC